MDYCPFIDIIYLLSLLLLGISNYVCLSHVDCLRISISDNVLDSDIGNVLFATHKSSH